MQDAFKLHRRPQYKLDPLIDRPPARDNQRSRRKSTVRQKLYLVLVGLLFGLLLLRNISTRDRLSPKNSARISRDGVSLLRDFKIDPLTRHAVLLACQRVVDDDLKDVFARR
jgi:hypothetical protein